MWTILGIYSCLLLTLHVSEAAVTFTYEDSIAAVQGQTATFVWTANLGIGRSWLNIRVNRDTKTVIDDNTKQKLVEYIKAQGQPEMLLTSRKADMDITVSDTSVADTINVTFTLRNLVGKTDDMYYWIKVVNDYGQSENTYTKLNVTEPPNITYPANVDCRSFHVIERGNASLFCNATGKPEPSITWKKDGVTLQSKGSPLILTDVERNQAGNYTCTADNGIGKPDTACWTLKVKYLSETPTISIQPDKNSVCLGMTSTVNITCNTTVGYPAATNLSFFVNGSPIKTIEGTLNGQDIKATTSIKMSKAGSYSFTCQATNAAGPTERSSAINVTVKDPPVIANCTNKTVNESDSLSWTCSAGGSQPLTTSWYKGDNNTVISSEQTLNIASVKKCGVGKYTFNVSNGDECPTASKTVYLTVQCPSNITFPEIEGCKSIDVNEGKDISLYCNATGVPKPTISWKKDGQVLPNGSPLKLSDVKRDQAGNYTCTADNGIGKQPDTACWNLNVHYFQTCEDGFQILDEGCTEAFPFNSNPVPELTCSPEGILKDEKNNTHYRLCGKKTEETSTCTLENDANKCSFKVKVLAKVKGRKAGYRFRCTNIEFDEKLKNKNSQDFKDLKAKFEKMLNSVYRLFKYVESIEVIDFWPGSVIVNYQLNLVADTSDPLAPLNEALNKSSNGTLGGLAIDSKSVQAGPYVPPTTTAPPPKSETPKPPGLTTEALIAISVVVPLVLFIIILIVYCCCCRKNREDKSREHFALEEGGAYRPMNGAENRGMSESPPSYAKSGPKSDANGRPEDVHSVPSYASVDASKPKEELVYAELQTFRPNGNNNKGTELQPMTGSGKTPEKYESDYAEIVGFKRQVIVKDRIHNGSFRCTNREYQQDKMSDAFKNLKSEVEVMLKSVHEDATTVEVTEFRPAPEGVIVAFQLNLSGDHADPMLPLKEAVEKNEGKLDGLMIDPESVQAEYVYSGSCKCTNRVYDQDLIDKTTKAFKTLKAEIEKMVKSVYEDSPNFVMVEAEDFRPDPDGVIAVFQLKLKNDAAEPLLLLKETLEGYRGTVNGLKIDLDSLQAEKKKEGKAAESEDEKQTKANAAAKPDVAFASGNQSQGSSSAASQGANV